MAVAVDDDEDAFAGLGPTPGEQHLVARRALPRIRFAPMFAAVERDLRHGFRRIHTLHHAEAREVWATWLLDAWAERGHAPASEGIQRLVDAEAQGTFGEDRRSLDRLLCTRRDAVSERPR